MRLPPIAVALSALAVHSCSRPVVTLATQPAVALTCSETRPGVEVATVRVRVAQTNVNAARLDFTVFKDGFETNRYSSVDAHPSERARRVTHASQRTRQHAHTAHDVDSVTVTQRNDSLSIRVEKLEPGLNYYFRFMQRVGNTRQFTRPTLAHAPTCSGGENLR